MHTQTHHHSGAHPLAAGISRTLKVHLPIALLEEAKARTGLTDDEELLKEALLRLVSED